MNPLSILGTSMSVSGSCCGSDPAILAGWTVLFPQDDQHFSARGRVGKLKFKISDETLCESVILAVLFLQCYRGRKAHRIFAFSSFQELSYF